MQKKKAAGLILIATLILASCQTAPSAAPQELPSAQPPQIELREPAEQAPKGVIRNPDFDEALTPEVQQIVLDFMDQWFAAQANLLKPDFSGLFDESTIQGREALAFNEMVLSCMTEIRRSRPNDLTFTEYDFGITFWRVKENEDGSLRLAFMEDSRVRFAFLPDMSSHVGYHSMTLIRVDGAYKITSHLDRQDAGLTVHKEYEQRKKDGNLTPERLTDAEVKRLLSVIKSELLTDAGEKMAAPSVLQPAQPRNPFCPRCRRPLCGTVGRKRPGAA